MDRFKYNVISYSVLAISARNGGHFKAANAFAQHSSEETKFFFQSNILGDEINWVVSTLKQYYLDNLDLHGQDNKEFFHEIYDCSDYSKEASQISFKEWLQIPSFGFSINTPLNA